MKFISVTAGVMTALLFSSAAIADDPVTMNISGKVTASPCTVDGDSINKTIDLGNGQPIQTSTLYEAGSATPWITFHINLKDCPTGTTKATITFAGTPDEDNPDDMYKNSGTATNVAVQLQGTGGDKFGNGKYWTGVVDKETYTYNLKTRAFTQNGQVSPGTINAVVTASFTYQ
ncbi:fimbrial protein [Cronobacter sakazakii]|uniref:fimbrial protein n=1 Tax=Cronobacter sakazakii TaxID=28141 RepID=UPI000E0036C0|nr:fimbrial protein [Cronobacter sakazakii]STD10677.1 fimbrial-like adhesin protein SfmF [Cronobacter sakazakii]